MTERGSTEHSGTSKDIKTIDGVIDFWLGEIDERGLAKPEAVKRWWVKDEAFDQEICACFGCLYDELVAGEHGDWLESPRGRLASVIVYDQFSRNMFRATAKMYATDAKALETAKMAIEKGDARTLGMSGRVLLYMPFMHSEALDDQKRCVDLFAAFAEEVDGNNKERIMGNHEYAVKHMAIVERFGRFPHRNEILGRPSTPEEIEFLKQPGSGF